MTSNREFPKPILTVDAVPLTVRRGRILVGLARRQAEPEAGRLGLVGGYVHVDEDRDLEDAIRRVLRTKVGLENVYVEQLGSFSGPTRDPRGWSATVVHLALIPSASLPEDIGLEFVPIDETGPLAFDHSAIVRDAERRVRGKSGYSILPARFLADTFTLEDLRAVYEAVRGERVQKASFRRKALAQGFLVDTGEVRSGGYKAGRDAALYRLNERVETFERVVW